MNRIIDRKLEILSPWGDRIHPVNHISKFHYGNDIRAHFEPIYTPEKVKGIFIGYDDRAGHYVKLTHLDNSQTVYCHLSEIYCSTGKDIELPENNCFAISGNSGCTTGPHLHFGRKLPDTDGNMRFVDPESYLRKLWAVDIIKTAGIPILAIGILVIIIIFS